MKGILVMQNTRKVLEQLKNDGLISNYAIRVGKKNEIIGEVYSDGIDQNTLFDMASVTKIMATASITLIALEKGLITLDTKVSDFWQTNNEKKNITVYNLLTHTIGMGWAPLYKSGKDSSEIAEYILNMPNDIPVGSDVMYSCPAFIVLGKLLEKVMGKPLDVLFNEFVRIPLGMQQTSFNPTEKTNIVNNNLKDDMLGMVNDDNCRVLGGVLGNAGVFSNINDVTLFVKMLNNKGFPIISEEIFDKATQNYTADMSESRGLGFLYVDKRYSQTGGLFSEGSIGHCGHTGQSVFVDKESGLYVIFLSDATLSVIKKFGFDKYGEVVKMREIVHNAIKKDLGV